MFGAWGEPDHDTSIKDHPPGPGRGINFIDTADVYSQGESESHRRKGASRRASRRRRARHEVPRPDGRRHATPTGGATPAAGSCRRSRTACAGSTPTGSTSTRCIGPTRTPTSRRPCPRSPTCSAPGKIRAFGSSTFPAHQIVEAQWVAEKRGTQPLRHRTAALLDARARHRGRHAAGRGSSYGMGVLPWSPLAGGWLTGAYRKGQEARPPAAPIACPPATTSRSRPISANSHAADALAELAEEAGISLIHMAIAFVMRHPP